MTNGTDANAARVTLLAHANPRLRHEAAHELYHAGVALCEPALDEWRTDGEFAELLVRASHEHSPWRMVVGIAVRAATFEDIHKAMGSPKLADVPPDQDAKEFEIHCEDGAELDILTARDSTGTGPIAKFVEKFGEGIQQVEVYVLDVDRATAILHSRFGVVSLYPKPRPGADGTRINFFLAKAPANKKVLVELVQAPTPTE
jgi:hypothetical protein